MPNRRSADFYHLKLFIQDNIWQYQTASHRRGDLGTVTISSSHGPSDSTSKKCKIRFHISSDPFCQFILFFAWTELNYKFLRRIQIICLPTQTMMEHYNDIIYCLLYVRKYTDALYCYTATIKLILLVISLFIKFAIILPVQASWFLFIVFIASIGSKQSIIHLYCSWR